MTFMTEGVGASEILRSDKLGRVQVAQERREAILDEFERSGMSGIAFARHHGINYQTFAAWRQRRKKTPTVAPARKSSFVLVEPAREVPSNLGLEIELGGGARVWIRSRADVGLAAELIRNLHP
jgi:transposase-like protein